MSNREHERERNKERRGERWGKRENRRRERKRAEETQERGGCDKVIKPDRGSGGIPASERGREGEGTEGTRYYSSQGVSFPLSSCCFHLEPPKGGGGGFTEGLGSGKVQILSGRSGETGREKDACVILQGSSWILIILPFLVLCNESLKRISL